MSSQFERHHDRHHHHHHLDRRPTIHKPEIQDVWYNQVKIFIQDNYRYIIANGIPNHPVGSFPNAIEPQKYCFRMPINPHLSGQIAVGRQPFGVAINGVLFDPVAAEFWRGDRHSGWQYEALSSKSNFGLDTNNAHVRPNGAYHYHGLPVGLVAKGNKKQMLLIGYAADGFPIYTQYGYSEPNNRDSQLEKIHSSYRLKLGQRPHGPGGEYDGTFVQDYEYISGAGELDECNGRFGVTPDYSDSIYHYYITEEFPFISRYFRGIPDPSFQQQRPHSRQRPPQ